MKWFMIVMKVFIIGALLIISNGNLAMKEQANREIFYHQYSLWFAEIVEKGVAVTGYVVSTEWLPDKQLSIINNNVSLKSLKG